MPKRKILVVFVHGWSVTNTDTYGGLPERLRREASANGAPVDVREIFLGRYITFHDDVRLPDVSRAFRAAVREQLGPDLADGTRFACITHSTGGPVVRDWWHRFHGAGTTGGPCPMSHLIMLAPANYGSALAQLGKGRLSRIKAWFQGVEPGQGILDWLELGSREAWDLNAAWIRSDGTQIGPNGAYPFVLTGQSIDRRFYDHLNSYTGEPGSDGVVRVAAANLAGRYVRLAQRIPEVRAPGPGRKPRLVADELEPAEFREAPPSALRVIRGKSHAGRKMGIMLSVKPATEDRSSAETVAAILACLGVETDDAFAALCRDFANETDAVQAEERLEIDTRRFRRDTHFIHDRYCMVVFRVRDHEGHAVTDFDLLFTGGPKSDPNHLPRAFLADRQRNHLSPETLTCFFDYDLMAGTGPVVGPDGKTLREAEPGAEMLGLRVIPRPDRGFVHYLPCEIGATADLLEKALHPNGTTLVDIELRRVVHRTVFRLGRTTPGAGGESFRNTPPGDEIVE
jgi:hypothetical protein